MRLTESKSNWRPRRWRRKIWPYRSRSMRKVWWRLLQRLWPRAMQPPPASARRRSAKTPPALQTHSSLAPGCPIPKNKHPRTLRVQYNVIKSNGKSPAINTMWNRYSLLVETLKFNVRGTFQYNAIQVNKRGSIYFKAVLLECITLYDGFCFSSPSVCIVDTQDNNHHSSWSWL